MTTPISPQHCPLIRDYSNQMSRAIRDINRALLSLPPDYRVTRYRIPVFLNEARFHRPDDPLFPPMQQAERDRYEHLADLYRAAGWTVRLEIVENGPETTLDTVVMEKGVLEFQYIEEKEE